MMSLWDALRMNMMISYQELVRTFLRGIYEDKAMFLQKEFVTKLNVARQMQNRIAQNIINECLAFNYMNTFGCFTSN
ncbi:hypothetical protein QQX85_29780, partial [Klebsiella variicola]|uniref:hypothetical protein n=1 Tax=Klebsiella variicola TaxID=244366 RepID=UPI0022545F13